MLTLIVARAKDGAIGKEGDIPWYAPEDLAMFKRETLGGALIMGRNTWDSLPFKPLKNRYNVVVSRGEFETADYVARSCDEALKACADAGYTRVYGIGGASIYAALLETADRMLVTEVDLSVPDADTFFPEFDTTLWRNSASLSLRTQAPKCTLTEWLRKA